MNSRRPSGENIVQLLFLAPENIRLNFGLSEETRESFVKHLDSCTYYECIEMLALALFYSCKSIAKIKQASPVVSKIKLDATAIYSLIKISRSEEFAETSCLLEEVAKEARSDKATNAVKARHSKPGSKHLKTEEAREVVRQAWASGNYDSRDLCAEQEAAALGVPFSTARKALINEPDPSK